MTVQPIAIDETLQSDLDAIAGARIYFGHQSVGGNILDGLADLQRRISRPTIVVRELGGLNVPYGQGALLHSAIGRNGNPGSKCDDFKRAVAALDGRLDMALFKFCYVDFDDTSDVDAIFSIYSRTLDEVGQRYPGLTVVPVTAPLRMVETGLGVWVRERLGRRNRAKHANARRNEFNRRLRKRYAGRTLYDLAAIMATGPDGRRQTFSLDGQVHDSLVPAFTNDGGHLNEVGRALAAAGLVRSLAGALRAAGRLPAD